MANPPASGSRIAVHLTDRALTPLISSSRSPPPTGKISQAQSQSQAQSLSSLTTAAITAYDSASRLDLGLPKRILIETGSSGPVILHSYLNPESSPRPQSRHARTPLGSGREIVVQAREDLRPLSGTTDDTSVAAQGDEGGDLVNGNAHDSDYESGLDAGEETPAAEEDRTALLPPLLIATVVAAGAGDTMEARRAAAKLERMGREFQREFVREEAEPREAIAGSEDG
jgi:hypothetical protein